MFDKMAGTCKTLAGGVLDAFVTFANTAVKMKLVSQEGDVDNDAIAFSPEFSHQFFGDSESIFGYRDLKIQLYYTASRLTMYLGITYAEKITAEKSGGVQPDNVLQIIGEKLESGYTSNLDDFVASLPREKSFLPMGEKLHSFTADSTKESYEVYKCHVDWPGFKDYHMRMQTFILWFIDAASYIDTDDDRWEFFVLFNKSVTNGAPLYKFAGYATVYKYYAYPTKTRPRISQMLILPPYQKQGLGAELLQTVYNWYIPNTDVVDITVEDPSETFTRLRDYVDAKNCMQLPSFKPPGIEKGFSENMRNEAQSKLKLNKKQARRVYEILRYKATDKSDREAYRSFRLDVKRRINAPYQRQQCDLAKLEHTLSPDEFRATLQCMNREQRIEQLEKQYQDLETEYTRIVERLES